MASTLPAVTRARTHPLAGPLAAGAAVAVCTAGLALWNPGDNGIPLCPTKAMSGLDCPFCGGLRTVAALGRGDIARAADHNLLLTLLAPVAVVWWVMWLLATREGRPAPMPKWSSRITRVTVAGLVVVTLAFTVVRNLRFGGHADWLASSASA